MKASRLGASRALRILVNDLRWRTVFAAAALVGTACAPPAPTADPVSESELIMLTFMEAMQTADTALLVDLFWPEATYDDFTDQHTYQGLEEIVGHVTGVHGWGDDVYINVGELHAGETTAVAEWVFSAVQARSMGTEIPVATGREVVLNGVTILEIEGGRIIRAADYTDGASMMLQLGARIELPGGVTIEQDPGGA